MRRHTRALLALLLALLTGGYPAFGQQPQLPQSPLLPRYQANFSAALTAAGSAVTVQATAASDAVSFENALVYCSVACTITLSINGTAATTTALTVKGPLSVASAVPPAAFSASNVGAGTTLQSWFLAAAQQITIPLNAYYLPAKAGGAANLTLTSNAVTGTVVTQIQWVNQ